MLKLGIIGLPNVGKSTIFNTLTAGHAPAENYPFTTIEPNVGTVLIPDNRLDALAGILHPEKIVPAHLEFVDIAGLVAGAHEGEGLGNKFLSHIRDVAAVVHIVRCFASGDVAHVAADIVPRRDVETIHTELMLSDLAVLERNRPKLERTQDKESRHRAALMDAMIAALGEGRLLRDLELDAESRALAVELGLLTHKRELYVANLGDIPGEEQEGWAAEVEAIAKTGGSECVRVYGRLESELLDLPEDDRKSFLDDLSLNEPTTHRLIHAGFRLLDLVTYFTTENRILQSWNITRGSLAPRAAGQIHSDMEHGFISADVVSFDDLVRTGSMGNARHEGCLRQEGKHYEVRDGDVFRFHFA